MLVLELFQKEVQKTQQMFGQECCSSKATKMLWILLKKEAAQVYNLKDGKNRTNLEGDNQGILGVARTTTRLRKLLPRTRI